ncbi:MAG: transglycosylase SLT domain-containing protein [Proteobacteria bacterium]|nr:transglycosylase SLT domain-containing protein [Pseudomonadota bacterium]
MPALFTLFRIAALLLTLNTLMGVMPSVTSSARAEVVQSFYDYPLPKSVSLCGEPLPLENRFVWEMLDREFNIAVWDRAKVFLWLKRAGRYFPHIEKKLAQAGMPKDLKYLAVVESSLIPYIQSSKGAIGTWQFMEDTARTKGLRKDRMIDERRSFERSTDAALKYLKSLKDKFGTWTLAFAAYNCGEARLEKEIKVQRVKDYYRLELPFETERFIFRIAAAKMIMENPKRYGYNMAEERTYRPFLCDEVAVNVRVPLHIPDLAQDLGTDLKTIRDLNPQIISYYLPAGQYSMKVPAGMGAKLKALLKEKVKIASYRTETVSDEFYVVRPGDTLSFIEKKTGVSVATMKKLNRIQGSMIMVGQKIKLRP